MCSNKWVSELLHLLAFSSPLFEFKHCNYKRGSVKEPWQPSDAIRWHTEGYKCDYPYFTKRTNSGSGISFMYECVWEGGGSCLRRGNLLVDGYQYRWRQLVRGLYSAQPVFRRVCYHIADGPCLHSRIYLPCIIMLSSIHVYVVIVRQCVAWHGMINHGSSRCFPSFTSHARHEAYSTLKWEREDYTHLASVVLFHSSIRYLFNVNKRKYCPNVCQSYDTECRICELNLFSAMVIYSKCNFF